MSKKMNETTKTSAELELELKTLKKRIEEKKRDEFLAPFITMIFECQKTGKLGELNDAFWKVTYVKNLPESSEEIAEITPAVISDVYDVESDIESIEE